MSGQERHATRTLGLFAKRIQGDDALMELARRRFSEAGMGAEMHAATLEQLDWSLGFRPGPETPVVVHLPREFNLVEEESSKQILKFAMRFASQVYGLVLHDHAAMTQRRNEYISAAWKLEEQLEKVVGAPVVFVEYAAGLEPADFARFFLEIRDLERISACVDTGHVGIRAARAAYSAKHRGEDVCALKSQGPRLRQVMTDVEQAVAEGAATTLRLVSPLSKLNKPLHFHLHDGHPLSTFSPFGVSDHLSFETEIPLNFEYHGRRAVPAMYGSEGLVKIVKAAMGLQDPSRLSFTLEIHPTHQRLPLGEASSLFQHWTDKTNAEQMNHWLAVLSRNHKLLLQAIAAAMPETGLSDLTRGP